MAKLTKSIICATIILSLSLPALPVRADPLADAAALFRAGDQVKAIEIWRDLAGRGDPDGQYCLGRWLFAGSLYASPKERDYGWGLIRQAAENAHIGAQTFMGMQILLIAGDPPLPQTYLGMTKADAEKFLQSAASQGDPMAQLAMARLVLRSTGVEDEAAIQSYKWLSIAVASLASEQGQAIYRDYEFCCGQKNHTPEQLEREVQERRENLQTELVAWEERMTADQIQRARQLAAEWAAVP